MKSGYVGFWRRVFAYFLDVFFFGTVSTIIFTTFTEDALSSNNTFVNVLSFVLSSLYFIFFWSSQDGQTIGNRILKIKVVKEDGKALGFSGAIVRYIGLIFSFAILFLGVLWTAFDKKKQGLHDKLAHTVVIETGKPNIFMVILSFLVMGTIYAVMFSSIVYSAYKNKQFEVGGHMNPTTLSSEVFTKINETRKSEGLVELKQDSRLCAYGQRRLEQINILGRNDDGKGFYEDTTNPDMIRAYFVDNPLTGQMYSKINLYSEADSLVDGWANLESSNLKEKRYTNGCVRADENHMVLILGGK